MQFEYTLQCKTSLNELVKQMSTSLDNYETNKFFSSNCFGRLNVKKKLRFNDSKECKINLKFTWFEILKKPVQIEMKKFRYYMYVLECTQVHVITCTCPVDSKFH